MGSMGGLSGAKGAKDYYMGGRGGGITNLNPSRLPLKARPLARLPGSFLLVNCLAVSGSVAQSSFAWVCACTPSRERKACDTATASPEKPIR